MRLQGKTALVTAAGQGIGKASVLAMAAEGAQVIATDLNPKLLAAYEGVANVRTAVLDVLDKSAIQSLVATLPPLQVLFNCAGFVHNGSIQQASDEEWDFAFNLNVRAQYWMIQAVLPGMLAGGGGSIINLTKSVAADFVGKGIRCNAIAPGTVDTPSLQDRINSYADPVQARKDFIARQPMGRLAQAPEIAPIVVYLASDESVFASGQIFAVDGGMTI